MPWDEAPRAIRAAGSRSLYTNIYLPIDRACATTVVPNRRNDIEGRRRRLKKRAGEVEKTGEKAGRHEMGAQDASNLRLEIFFFFLYLYQP